MPEEIDNAWFAPVDVPLSAAPRRRIIVPDAVPVRRPAIPRGVRTQAVTRSGRWRVLRAAA